MDYYTQYADLKHEPVNIYLFNFTTPFSLSILTNTYPVQERGASHFDDLMYLFRFRAFDGLFKRGVPENEMKDLYVRFIVDYVRYGKSSLYRADPCQRRDMNWGFCDYMDIQRNYRVTPNRPKISASNWFDMRMVEMYRELDKIIAQEG